MTWRPSAPYNDLPGLPPRAELETKPVLKLVIEARAALAALDQSSRSLPNPTVLLNAIPILEAQASSEIENIVTTTDDLFRYAQDESAATSPATREALRYRTALFTGFQRARSRPLSATTAAEICSLIKQREMQVRQLPGTYIGSPVDHAPIYTPPVGADVIRSHLQNWEEFVHADGGLDPLVTMAVAHYQFEAIHPFEDGNGRTGRVLNVLLLVAAGLLSQPILYLSRYIIENKSAYYELLLRVTRDGDWQSWILYMLEGVRQTAEATIRKIDAIKQLEDEVTADLRAQFGTVNADLLAVLFEQPYARIATVMARTGVSRPTATNWLNALAESGALVKLSLGRERLFVNTRFMELLTRDESIAGDPSSLF
ncbi:MAG: addiction module protein [Leifsonia xyli]|nr:MAG: addiction module protein [Leifsonia xyli]